MSKKFTYEEVKSYIENQGYQLLSTEYENNRTKLRIKCIKGHIFNSTYYNFKNRKKCPICSNESKKLNDAQITYFIESKGYKKHSNYKDVRTKMKLECPKGHIFYIKWNSFKDGHRCPSCYNEYKRSKSLKLTYKEVKNYIESFGYKLLSKNYKNTRTKLKLECPESHTFLMTHHGFKKGKRCPICWYQSTSSKPEKEIQIFIDNIYDGKIINNDRNTIINPYTGYNLELDIYLPELNKAIEFNGSYWHSLEKTIENDKIKLKQCKENNINLFVLQEQLYLTDKEKCLNKIYKFIYD